MTTELQILKEVSDSHRDTNILELLESKGIAVRSFTSDVLIEIHTATRDLEMTEETKAGLELRISFLIRYIKDLEFRNTEPAVLWGLKHYQEGTKVVIRHARDCPCPRRECWAAPDLWREA